MASIGIPIAGAFTADGGAYLETIPAESFVWTGADATFAGEMTVDEFKNAFVLSEVNDDGVAELTVSMDASGETAFKAALLNLLDGAATLDAAVTSQEGFERPLTVGASNLEDYLKSWAQRELDFDLSSNGIPANVEAEHFVDLSLNEFRMDASRGVIELWDDMVAANATNSLNIIARQIPRARYGEVFSPELKVQAEDVITFRFVIGQTYVVGETGLKEQKAALTGVSSSDPATGTSALVSYPGIGANYGVAARNVDLVITLK